MPTYRNDSGVILQMLGLNVAAGNTVETVSYPDNFNTVINGTELKGFTDAVSAGWVSKTSDTPSGMIIDASLGSLNATSDWHILHSRLLNYDVSIDMDTGSFTGTVEIQRKFEEDGDAKTVESFTASTETSMAVGTSAFYRAIVTSYTEGTIYVKVG